MSWLKTLSDWLGGSNALSNSLKGPKDKYRGQHIKVKVAEWKGCIWHHGIAINDEEVIHFKRSDQNESPYSKCSIEKTSIKDFCKGGYLIKVVRYKEEPFNSNEVVARAIELYARYLYKCKSQQAQQVINESQQVINKSQQVIKNFEKEFGIHLGSQFEETMKIPEYAYDLLSDINNKLNKNKKLKYNLYKNNCEHFATYCKTGKAESKQINAVIIGSTGIIGTIGAIIFALFFLSYYGNSDQKRSNYY